MVEVTFRTNYALKKSACSLFNNLSLSEGVSNAELVSYVGKDNSVLLVDLKRPTDYVTEVPLIKKSQIFTARICSFSEQNVLVVASEDGAEFWNLGMQLIRITFLSNGSDSDEKIFSIGVSRFQTKTCNLIAVGNSLGQVDLYKLERGAVVKHSTLDQSPHTSCISCISESPATARAPLLAVGDLSGVVSVWNENLTCLSRVNIGEPCTAIKFSRDGTEVIASFACGHIRVFDAESGVKKYEIAAHTRSINAIDVHPKEDLLATVGEDSCICVWKLPASNGGGDRDVKMVFSEVKRDTIWSGVQFGGYSTLLAIPYENPSLYSWTVNV